jgi:hypothetical protein
MNGQQNEVETACLVFTNSVLDCSSISCHVGII